MKGRADGNCTKCGALLKWIKTESGKNMPLNFPGEQRIVVVAKHPEQAGDPDYQKELMGVVQLTYTSHFVTCPNADEFRRKN